VGRGSRRGVRRALCGRRALRGVRRALCEVDLSDVSESLSRGEEEGSVMVRRALSDGFEG